MKERLNISGWELNVDFQATETAYIQLDEPCNCEYCQNFRLAYSFLPIKLTSFLKALSIDSSKPVHTSEVCQNQDGTHLYIVNYDIIGEIISGPNYIKDQTPKYFPIVLADMPPTIDASICGVPNVPGHFPNPAIEFQFILSVPWVLDKNG